MPFSARLRSIDWLFGVAVLGAASAAACSAGSEVKQPQPPAAPKGPVVDACLDSPPAWRPFFGPLRNVRCEQEMFLTMAGIADDLGVKCGYCHVAKPGGKTFDYVPMTPHKEVALWMDQTFMRSLKRADGKPMLCASCHVDKKGNPAAKFLGEPRDLAWTVEWMTTVMTNRFVLQNGEKLKCKHCHGGTWGTKDFIKDVIGKTEQVPHLELLPVAAPPTPGASDGATVPSAAPAAPSAGPAAASSSAPPQRP